MGHPALGRAEDALRYRAVVRRQVHPQRPPPTHATVIAGADAGAWLAVDAAGDRVGRAEEDHTPAASLRRGVEDVV